MGSALRGRLLAAGAAAALFVVSGCGRSKVTAGADAAPGGDAAFGTDAAAGADAPALETGADSSDAGSVADAVRACRSTSSTAPSNACRAVADCRGIPPVLCCVDGNRCSPPSACPISPSQCPGIGETFLCRVDGDCTRADGGTCVITVIGCPQCEYRNCVYPPSPCTVVPDVCGDTFSCQPNGSCAPRPCNAGPACPPGYRCSVGSARANDRGCELIPCDDGWTCDENTRCKTPDDPSSHGCAALACTGDGDCDCGYCVNGHCESNLGICTAPLQ